MLSVVRRVPVIHQWPSILCHKTDSEPSQPPTSAPMYFFSLLYFVLGDGNLNHDMSIVLTAILYGIAWVVLMVMMLIYLAVMAATSETVFSSNLQSAIERGRGDVYDSLNTGPGMDAEIKTGDHSNSKKP